MPDVTKLMGMVLSGVCISAMVVSLCLGEAIPLRPRSDEGRPPATGTAPGEPGPESLPGPPPRSVYGRSSVPKPRPIEGGSYYYELAEVHKRYGVYDKAIEMLKTAIEKETEPSKKTRYLESLSEVYRMKGDLKEAAAQINKALEGAQTIEAKCGYNSVLAGIHEEAGDLQAAKKAYEFVVANATQEGQKRSAQLDLFRLYQRSGELEKVVSELEKKLEKNPDDEQALDALAQIFNTVLREPSRALPVYEKLSKLKPKDTAILNRLVFLYQMDKKYEKAAEVYQKIIEATPSQNRSYYYQHVSRMYMSAGKKEEAIKWAEKSLSEGQAQPYTYISVARIYLQNNLPEKALELYDRAVAACRGAVEKQQISLQFADLFAQSKKEDKAEELYKYVLKEATVASLKSQARSRLVALYRRQGKTAEIEALTGEEKGGKAPEK